MAARSAFALPATAVLLATLLLPLAPAAPDAAASDYVITFTRSATPDELSQLPHARPLASIEGALATLTPAQLAAAARLPFVARIDAPEPLERSLDGSKALIRAPQARAQTGLTGKGVTIAVVDSGIDATHPDFEDRVLANVAYAGGRFIPAPTDTDGHGTHVAGIAAGSGAASGGRYVGVAPEAKLVGINITGAFTTASALEAFDWIFLNRDRYDIRVVVNSWGRVARGEAFDPQDPLIQAADRLVREGIVVVFSATNRGPQAMTLSLEAQNPNVLTVGATDDAGVLAPFSARGPVLARAGTPAWTKPDVVAPGVDVRAPMSSRAIFHPLESQSIPEGPNEIRYRSVSGTSQAAPHVAGIVALMLEANPRLRPADVARLLRETAIDLGPPGPDDAYGYGLTDARDAVQRARDLPADHGNVLIAGGTEIYEAAGTTTPAGDLTGRIPLNPVPLPASRLQLEFPVKPGASRATLEITWTGPGTYTARLTDGKTSLGPWSQTEQRADGTRAIRATVEPPHPGIWKLIADGTTDGPVTYALQSHVQITAHPERAGEPQAPAHQTGPKGEGLAGAFESAWDAARIHAKFAARDPVAWARASPVEAALALILLASMGGASAYVALRQRGTPQVPQPPREKP